MTASGPGGPSFLPALRAPRRMAAVALLACLPWLAGAVAAAADAPLTLAVADLPQFSPVLIADIEGYYASEGLTLKVLHCVNGRRCLKHLTDGEAQFAVVGDTPLVMASFGRTPFSVVATIGTTSRDTAMLARTDRGVRTAADLKGKRIGVMRGTTANYFSDALLLFHNISPSDVTTISLSAADPLGPLQRGEVDAAALYQPFRARALQAMGSQVIELASPKLFTITFNLVAAPAAAGGRDEDAVKLLRALQRANRLIAADPARARAILAARLKLEPKLLEAIWGEYDFGLSLGQPLITTLEAQARWAVREGMMPASAMPDYLDFMRPGPLQAVDRRSVTLVK